MKALYKTINVNEQNLDKKYTFLFNDAIGQTIERDGYWENHITEVLSKNLKEGENCLDLGANFGYHTITMAKLVCSQGKVFSFEPMRLFHQMLCANVCLNELTNVYTFQSAVGKDKGTSHIPEPDLVNTGVNHGANSLSHQGQIVNVMPIDLYEFPKIKFIKLDVQGCELDTLKGAEKILKRDQPLFVVEIENDYLYKFNTNSLDLLNFIKNELNYHVYQLVNNYPVDHLCVPKDYKIDLEYNSCTLKLLN
jgi:FkbM family methyltransferase